PAEEGLLGLDEPGALADAAGGGGGVERAFPEVEVVEALAAGGLEVVDQREAQGERLDAVEPEDDQGVGDGGDGVGLAVEGGVDGLEDLARQRGVVLNGRGDLADVDVGLLDEVDDLQSDRGQAGQPRRLKHTVEKLLVHHQTPWTVRSNGAGGSPAPSPAATGPPPREYRPSAPGT